jgi:hypothetical protein
MSWCNKTISVKTKQYILKVAYTHIIIIIIKQYFTKVVSRWWKTNQAWILPRIFLNLTYSNISLILNLLNNIIFDFVGTIKKIFWPLADVLLVNYQSVTDVVLRIKFQQTYPYSYHTTPLELHLNKISPIIMKLSILMYFDLLSSKMIIIFHWLL